MPLRIPSFAVIAALACLAAGPARAFEPEPVFSVLAAACVAGDGEACRHALAWAPDEGMALWMELEVLRGARARHDAARAGDLARELDWRIEAASSECDYRYYDERCRNARVGLTMACLYGHEEACWDLAAELPWGDGGDGQLRSLTLTLQAAEAGSSAAWERAPAPVTSARERRQAMHATGAGGWSTSWDLLEMEADLVSAATACDVRGAEDPSRCLELVRTVNGPAGMAPPARMRDLAGEMCMQAPGSSACVVSQDLAEPTGPFHPSLEPVAALLESMCHGAGDVRACGLHADLLELGRVTMTGSATSRASSRAACEGGHRGACLALEEAYRDGLAAALDQRCDRGDLVACHDLAMAQRAGAGLLRNPGAATDGLQAACDAGYPPSCDALSGAATDRWEAYPGEGTEHACHRGDVAACTVVGRGLLAGAGPVAAPRYGEALLRATCRAGDHEACGELARFYEAGAADQPARAGWSRALWHRSCVAGHEPACAELERMGPGPAEVPPFPGPEVKPPPPPPPPPVDPPVDPVPPRRPHRPPDIRDVEGLGFSLSTGTLRSWSADTQASAIRTGAELLFRGLGVGTELEHVTDYRFRPKQGRTYQRWTWWGHGMVRFPLADIAHLTIGAGGGLGTYRYRQGDLVFSGAAREFLEIDVVVVELLRFAIRVEQRQYRQFYEGFDTDHATGVFMTVGLYGEP